ncbi:MAG: 1-deoxy-D-xylulose-5-phosphate reductoisomerase [Candidatus Marsarchaeota archaeon]|nr:1-deoxy-D-xylulose-5-phosphate reductoisomerase [Candidatus Marsarchaeota archaeon]
MTDALGGFIGKGIGVYGSTGSIGTQTLEVARQLKGTKVVALSCKSNAKLMLEQIKIFKPKYAAVIDESGAEWLERRVKANGLKTEVLHGEREAINACTAEEIEIVVNAAVGIAGLVPTLQFIKNGKDLALANKESLVVGGRLVIPEAKKAGIKILPVDSEPSAVFQCMQGNDKGSIERLLLTASGGPFRGKSTKDLSSVTVSEALKHPTWKMGKRITIDSATLMNKGFEMIELHWMFDIPAEKIKVVIHPQSIVHSAVQYNDGNIIAGMGATDMKVLIQYALTYPIRIPNKFARLDLAGQALSFEEPDTDTFKCLDLAYSALRSGGTYPSVLNGSDEAAVQLFINGKIGFLDIQRLVSEALSDFKGNKEVSLENIMESDRWARAYVNAKVIG